MSQLRHDPTLKYFTSNNPKAIQAIINRFERMEKTRNVSKPRDFFLNHGLEHFKEHNLKIGSIIMPYSLFQGIWYIPMTNFLKQASQIGMPISLRLKEIGDYIIMLGDSKSLYNGTKDVLRVNEEAIHIIKFNGG